MDYKYYNALVFDTIEAAEDFSRSAVEPPPGEEAVTEFMWPVETDSEGRPVVLVVDLNSIPEIHIPEIEIVKINQT